MIPFERFLALSLLPAIALSCGSAATLASQNIQVRKVALTGDPVPDIDGHSMLTLARVSGATINDHGDVGFHGWAIDGTSMGWVDFGGELAPVAKAGDRPPGYTSAFVFMAANPPMVADNRTVAFFNTVDGPPIYRWWSQYGVWGGNLGDLRPLIAPALPSPGFDPLDYTWTAFPGPLSPSGKTVVKGNMHIGGADGLINGAVWAGDTTGVELVAREGQPTPEVAPGSHFSDFSFVGVNDSGRVLFIADISGSVSSQSIWTATPQERELVAKEGDPVPGAGEGAIFTDIASGRINNADEVAFMALFETPINKGNGVWIKQRGSGQPTPVAVCGSEAPGTGADFDVAGTYSIWINNRGEVGFKATLDGPDVNSENRWSSWVGDVHGLELIARQGSHVPGMEPDVVFCDYSGQPLLDDHGAVYMKSRIKGPGIDLCNDRVLQYRSPGGSWLNVLREGQSFEVGSGDFRTIREFGLGPMVAGYERVFNNHGELAVTLEFTNDTSGIFVLTVPEPSTLVLLSMGAVGLLAYAWRRRR